MKVSRKSFHFQGNQNAMLSEGILVQDCENREVNLSATISRPTAVFLQDEL